MIDKIGSKLLTFKQFLLTFVILLFLLTFVVL